MNDFVLDDNGIPRRFSDVEVANKIVKKRKDGDVWAVIDLLVNLWASKAPEEVKAVNINIDQYKETLTDKEFGATKGGKDLDRRFFLSFPTKLMMMIRTQYSSEELPTDKKFYNKFAKKYPFFMVSEKI